MLRAARAKLSAIQHLRTKLTVLYAGLFALALTLIAVAVYSAITSSGQRQVESELTASGTVFDRVWSLRSAQMQQGAVLLSRDFGFRAAVATRDQATIDSAMENLRSRFRIDMAFIVGVDGAVSGAHAADLTPQAKALASALYDSEHAEGLLVVAGRPYQAVAAPILSPDLVGWVVFAARLDQAEMTSLKSLAAIPLDAQVVRKVDGRWRTNDTHSAVSAPAVDRFVGRALKGGARETRSLNTAMGPAAALVKPLPSLTGRDQAVLLLTYPLAKAFAPYRPLLASIGFTGLAGLALVILGSWSLARSVTRPVSELDAAVGRLQRGEDALVQVDSSDEIGRLAESFNLMATEIRERERRITHLALHDAETGLPNRLSLEQAIDRLDVSGDAYVAVLGVDRFAHVRGAIGYDLAAQMIRGVAERLADLHRAGVVARLSSDTLGFTFNAPSAESAEAVMLHLSSQLELPVNVGGDPIDVALTTGLAPAGCGASASQVIEQASIGLDQARQGRRKIAFFDAAAYGDPASNLALMSGMLWGIRSGEIELHHQPKFDLRSRRIDSAEGLVRWRHPQRGMLRPDLFIPMAEETGHIRILTDWVLRQAILDQATLARAGHALEMSVNISGRLLGDHDFADFVERTVAGASGKLCFEITETAVIENPELALQMLDRFRGAGVGISIDDFGTGLSSLAYLKQIRGQELKIDRALIQDITESQRDALIVRSTIDLAHGLGLKVTAEGVETADAFQLLAAMGCDSIQGYLIARPQALGDLLTFLGDEDGIRRFAGR